MPVTMQMIADGEIDKLYPRGCEEKNGVEMPVVVEVVNAVLHAPAHEEFEIRLYFAGLAG